jgi:hypothetical protein
MVLYLLNDADVSYPPSSHKDRNVRIFDPESIGTIIAGLDLNGH